MQRADSTTSGHGTHPLSQTCQPFTHSHVPFCHSSCLSLTSFHLCWTLQKDLPTGAQSQLEGWRWHYLATSSAKAYDDCRAGMRKEAMRRRAPADWRCRRWP